MLAYRPDNLSPRPALVVVLHGSMQSAADYDLGAGWSTLADRYGFALLMPEQSRKNNLNRSFNWFQRNDTQRGEGEAHSIVQMVEQMVRDHDIDRRRVFVTGLSAGGAMTLAMLATYPDVFAAGAVIAGLPYGGATNAQEALRGMFQAPPKSSRELGDLVREASPNTTVWPKLSVWHGSADRTVKPSNASEIIKQWLNVHGLPLAPMSEQIVDGHPRQVWWNAEGETVIESYMITDMAHGTPLSRSEGGVAGPYMIEAGISSSDHIAKFFGLTDATFKAPAETTKLLRPVPLFGALRKATRSPRIRAVRAWRDAGDNIAKMLIAVGLMKASITVIVMQPPGIRQQPLRVGFEAGRKNDGIKPFHPEAEKMTPSGLSFQWRLAP
jgi:poly(hydroxyalkanoate) depolymerase family esterase